MRRPAGLRTQRLPLPAPRPATAGDVQTLQPGARPRHVLPTAAGLGPRAVRRALGVLRTRWRRLVAAGLLQGRARASPAARPLLGRTERPGGRTRCKRRGASATAEASGATRGAACPCLWQRLPGTRPPQYAASPASCRSERPGLTGARASLLPRGQRRLPDARAARPGRGDELASRPAAPPPAAPKGGASFCGW